MSAFVGRILALIAAPVLEWIYQKLAVAIHDWVVSRRAQEELEKQARAAREQTEKATTPKEREDATDTLRDNW